VDVAPLVAWLVDGAMDATRSEDVLARVCRDLIRAGVPISRAEAFVRTLHPHVVGRSFVFRASDGTVEVKEQTYDYLQSPEFLSGPVAETFRTGDFVRVRLGKRPDRDHSSVKGLSAEGFTDFFVVPLRFRSGEVHAITFATERATGFGGDDLDALRAIAAPLSRVAEILALSRVAGNLLRTYVGADAGKRILSGNIRRGDVDEIRAVIWCSDLRGFTAMTGSEPPAAVIRALNELFECQIVPIESRGGEVLKFIGDGLLAIFRVTENGRTVDQQCEAGLAAAREAFANLAVINRRREERGDTPLRVGLALHVGDVAYGNIGSARRLDFTCIGPAVNLAARMEGVASKLGRDLVVSDEFRRHSTSALEPLGEFDLKGIAAPQAVYGLVR
jgi:adenylate cyclase